LARTRILLVDDDGVLLRLIAELLEPEFEVVGTVTGGQAMISAAEDLDPDVIVADVEMPGLDGINASRAVLKSKPTLPIVILTTHRHTRLVYRALDAGARGYVHKLSAGDELVLAIHSALQGRTFVSPTCLVLP
jgi:DNA-binding NarL/FixJ family response regulator